jgi:transcriptional regulator with XRE-family HTH domain
MNEEALPLIDEIRQAIKESELSLTELGRKTSVSQPQLSRFLSGQRTLTLPAAARLCRFLGLKLVKEGAPVTKGERKSRAQRQTRE